MITAKVKLERLIQRAEFLDGDVLRVRSNVYLTVEIEGRRGPCWVVETEQTLDSQGVASDIVLKLPRLFGSAWDSVECGARVKDYVRRLSPSRDEWFDGLGGALMGSRLVVQKRFFEFAYDDGTGLE